MIDVDKKVQFQADLSCQTANYGTSRKGPFTNLRYHISLYPYPCVYIYIHTIILVCNQIYVYIYIPSHYFHKTHIYIYIHVYIYICACVCTKYIYIEREREPFPKIGEPPGHHSSLNTESWSSMTCFWSSKHVVTSTIYPIVNM